MSVVSKVIHSRNSKEVGEFIAYDNGNKVYLAYFSGAKNKHYIPQKNAWCLPLMEIRHAHRSGCTHIGIRHKVGKKYFYYITTIHKYLGEPSTICSLERFKEPMRVLNVNEFEINSLNSPQFIEKIIILK